jgi:hypothetical protein
VGIAPSKFKPTLEALDYEQLSEMAAFYSRLHGNVVFDEEFVPRAEERSFIGGAVTFESAIEGVTFVGTYTRGVPQGIPVTGALVAGTGSFELVRPICKKGHLMAAYVPQSPGSKRPEGHLNPTMISILRLDGDETDHIELKLRGPEPTDPPLVACLPAILSNVCKKPQ